MSGLGESVTPGIYRAGLLGRGEPADDDREDLVAGRVALEARERVDTHRPAGPHELLLDHESLVAEGVEVDGHPVEHVIVTDARGSGESSTFTFT